jgi:hypothetical protein
MIFGQFAPTKARSSAIAMALALATGSVLGVAALEAPAHAQKKSKKPKYSKGFVEAYSPVNDQVAAQADPAVLLASVPTVAAALETADDQFAGGNLIYTIGQRAGDQTIQLQGIETMLGSGKVPVENAPSYNFLAGQLAYQQSQFSKARKYMQIAADLGYTENDPQAIVAETYFSENKNAEGLSYLSSIIDQRKGAGQVVPQDWIQRGLSVAYNNNMLPQSKKFSLLYVSEFPSQSSWGDAIAIVLNTSKFEYPEILDLLRLARRTDTLRDPNLYLEYIEAADARRNPAEVLAIIDKGYADGQLARDDGFVADSRAQAAGRLAADKRDLPALGRDARASSAGLRTVMAAGDAYLSYDRGAEAEEFYTKAASMAGVNMPLALTRLGIAQLDQGKFGEAQATFSKVEGERKNITDLYSVWAGQKAAAAPAPAAVAPPVDPAITAADSAS